MKATETARGGKAAFARGRLHQARYLGSALSDAAMGRIPCDLRIDGAQIVNVLTGEIYPGSVAIHRGVIVHVTTPGHPQPLEARMVYDAQGRYAVPGLIDSHMHVESTMLTPDHFARVAIAQGTTTAVTDPHEIANVCGVDGVRYMLEAAQGAPIRQLVMVPSCVPAVPGLERAGAAFDTNTIAALLAEEGVIGVAEMMDYVGVTMNSPRARAICALADGLQVPIGGHAPTLVGAALSAYLLAGPLSDHECTGPGEVLEKLRLGMHVDLRASSLGEGAEALTEALRGLRYIDRVTLCTDDVHISDILERGHLNWVVAQVIARGVAPVDALRMATLNAAQEYGITNLGAVAPGYLADILLVDDLAQMRPHAVFLDGQLVAEEGRVLTPKRAQRPALEALDTVRLTPPEAEALRLRGPKASGTARTLVIDCQGNDFATGIAYIDLPIKDGYIDLTDHPECMHVAVLNRHGAGGMTQAIVRNIGLARGAVATTNAHDSHNLLVVYRTAEEAALAIRTVIGQRGGWCVVLDGQVAATLPLPIGGLMSPLPAEALAPQADALVALLHAEGLDATMRLSTLALPVIPAVRVTDLGIVDVAAQRFMPLFDPA